MGLQVQWVGAEVGEAEELVAGEVDQLGGMQTQFQMEKAMKDKARGEKATKEKATEARMCRSLWGAASAGTALMAVPSAGSGLLSG